MVNSKSFFQKISGKIFNPKSDPMVNSKSFFQKISGKIFNPKIKLFFLKLKYMIFIYYTTINII
jgi:hypothetical protein